MGFFSELKQDLSQAVNELVPDENSTEKTDLQKEDTGISLEEMISMIDEIVPEEETVQEETFSQEESSSQEVIQEEVVEPEVVENSPQATEEVDIMEILEKDLEQMQATQTPDQYVENEKKEGTRMDIFAGKTASDETSVITAGMCIKGDIITEGSLDIIGTVEGNMDVLGKLSVSGTVIGDARASEIFADGAHIQGEVQSEGTVKIGANCVIIGNITANSAAIAGAVKGDIDVHGPVIVDAGAIVMGNIRSKSVQINNGAMIEGLCSQCYAENNPTDFFEKYMR